MARSDALPILLDEDTMRPAAANLGPAIALERREDAGSCYVNRPQRHTTYTLRYALLDYGRFSSHRERPAGPFTSLRHVAAGYSVECLHCGGKGIWTPWLSNTAASTSFTLTTWAPHPGAGESPLSDRAAASQPRPAGGTSSTRYERTLTGSVTSPGRGLQRGGLVSAEVGEHRRARSLQQIGQQPDGCDGGQRHADDQRDPPPGPAAARLGHGGGRRRSGPGRLGGAGPQLLPAELAAPAVWRIAVPAGWAEGADGANWLGRAVTRRLRGRAVRRRWSRAVTRWRTRSGGRRRGCRAAAERIGDVDAGRVHRRLVDDLVVVLVGGRRAVEQQGVATVRTQFGAAGRHRPPALGTARTRWPGRRVHSRSPCNRTDANH